MPETKKRRALGFVLIVLVILPLYSCSTVFTASISGSTIDKESWEEDDQEIGIGDVEIFLYNDEKDWTEDYTRWTEEGIRPDTVEEGEGPNFFLSTITGADGAFTFGGFIWNSFFPAYGKSGDRVEVYFLFYNRDYGITKNPTPVYIVSEVTNQLYPFKLERITNPATVEGTIINRNTDEGVGAVNISIYVADSLDPAEYPEEPDYQTTSGPEGEYTQTFSFPKALGDSGKVKITVDRNGFNCENYDGDGTPAGDYLETGLIEKETTYTAADIAIQQTEFNETLEGRYSTGGTYTNGVTLWVFYNDESASTAPSAMTPGPDVHPRDSTYTYAEVLNDATTENGHFTFPAIQWVDETYTTEKSTKEVYLYVPTANEISSGALTEGTGYEQKYTMTSFSSNYTEVTAP